MVINKKECDITSFSFENLNLMKVKQFSVYYLQFNIVHESIKRLNYTITLKVSDDDKLQLKILGFWNLSIICYFERKNVLETGSLSVLESNCERVITHVGPVERD
jgi:hypothetical protein